MASREELLDALGALWSHEDAARFELLVDEHGPAFFSGVWFPPRLPVVRPALEPPPGPTGLFRTSAG